MLENIESNYNNEYLPLRDVVFRTLRQAILKGELEPGERLMEIQLANKLGVSRTPIREAIRMLELEGLVLMIPRKGAEVARISAKNMQDVLEVRTSLEELASGLACRRMTDDDLQKLKDAEAAFTIAVSGGDTLKIAESDEAFHDVLYNATGNEKLVQILNNLREQMYRYRLEYIRDSGSWERLKNEHRMIIEAMEKRDIPAARKIIREHIGNQEKTILAIIREREAQEAEGAAAKKVRKKDMKKSGKTECART